ncbi:MAG: hemerythrin domain-containing protein [Bacteroidales bacterium]|nr:hemerythrin domain-containing protein [Bacteroidales bacterium]MDD2263807.1 hemerythrin domain-containing protein [Bacteroidales bacterium]MDD2830975.1 hemerythrin domain-containing protein [Bacteroidales bacterium]MDD3208217.1 hemerythrin domain-containing protein [Bacteroidales bacterium]MDD3696741.1 hemerythrin domain-containing protein [Bacteroidales bacterium]
MSELICDNFPMLFVMSRFGISPGFGEKTIRQVCHMNHVDENTFLAVVNLLVSGIRDETAEPSLPCLLEYLHNSHSHFLDFRLPSIRQKLLAALGTQDDKAVSAIIRFYDEYVEQVHTHMDYEEETVFPYVRSLLTGKKRGDYSIRVFCRQHDSIESKLSELKNILIKYYPPGNADELNAVLFDIFVCAQDLASHNFIEDNLFVPMISQMEFNLRKQ